MGFELGKAKHKRLLRFSGTVDDDVMSGGNLQSIDPHALGFRPGLNSAAINLERQFARATESRCAPLRRFSQVGGDTQRTGIRLPMEMWVEKKDRQYQ